MRQNTSATNPESPAIRTLADALERRFPAVSLLTTNNVRPGTRHTAGLAIDIMLDVRTTSERTRAHGSIRLRPAIDRLDTLMIRGLDIRWVLPAIKLRKTMPPSGISGADGGVRAMKQG